MGIIYYSMLIAYMNSHFALFIRAEYFLFMKTYNNYNYCTTNYRQSMELPIDIDYIIRSKLHPYYNLGYCSSNLELKERCESNKYYMLKEWVYPDFSTSALQEKFPNLTYNDVVELALVYNPIPESVKFYDRYTLFYHACRIGQEDPVTYLRINERYYQDIDVLTIGWICYKFNDAASLVTIINDSGIDYMKDERIRRLVYFVNMINMKNGKELTYNTRIILRGYIVDDDFAATIMNCWGMFTNIELIEAVIIMRQAHVDPRNSLYRYVINENSSMSTDYEEEFKRIVNKTPSRVLEELLNKHRIQRIKKRFARPGILLPPGLFKGGIRLPKDISSRDNKFNYYLFGTLVRKPEIVEECIDYSDLGLYYITSGNFAAYNVWKSEGNKLPEEGITGSNEFGYMSMNKDYTTFDDFDDYIKVSHIRKFACPRK